jgi:hypothetical protein
VSSILAFDGGAVNLGNMIASADCVGELRENYSEDNIHAAAAALLDEKYLHGFLKFSKSVARDETLWKSLVDVFSSKIADLPRKWTDEARAINSDVLDTLCDKYPDLSQAVLNAAEKPAPDNRTVSVGAGQSPSPC